MGELMRHSDAARRAIAFRDAVDEAISLADGNVNELQKLAKQARAIQEFIQKDKSLRQAANTIGIARLKIAVAIAGAIPRGKGGRGKTSTSASTSFRKETLAKYRKIADNQRAIGKYEHQLSEDSDVSFADFLRFVKPVKSSPPPVDSSNGHSIVNSLDDVAGLKFGTIYADPPWKYGNQGTRAATSNHYGTMTVAELCDMNVESVAADDAHLHLWTTNAFLFDAKLVIEAWGFEYRSCFVWVKPQMGIGNYWRVSHEFLLLGIRGEAKSFAEKCHMSWGQFERTKHSAKPEQVRGIIERVSPGPRLEMFGRKEAEGWTVMGNQVERRLIPA